MVYKGTNKFQTSGVIYISIAHFLHDVYSSFLAPLMPLLIEKLQFSYSTAGMLYVAQRLPALLNPFVGLLADKIPIRYVLISAPAVTSICMGLLGFASSITLLVVLLLLGGISSALFHVPAPVMIKHISGDRIGKGMSFFMFGGEGARSAGPVFILAAVSFWGLEGIFKVIPGGILASILLYFKFRHTEISSAFKGNDDTSSAKNTFKNILPLMAKVAGVLLFMSIIRSALTSFLPVFFMAKGESVWEGGLALSLVQLAGAFGAISSGTISDKLGRRNTLLIIGIVSPILMWVFVLFGSLAAAPILLLSGFFLFSSTSVLLAVINEYDSNHPAFINGLFMTINFLAGAGSVLLIGLLSDSVGFDATYKFTSVLGFLSIPFILSLDRKKTSSD